MLGFRGGYSGLDPAKGAEPVKITPQFVDGIHQKGGTILSSSRGPVSTGVAVDNLIARGINVLFTVGGDGTQRGANDLYQEARRRGHPLSVVGIPKTIDNDVGFVSRTFGFFSAIEEAARVLDCAHTEACSVPGGIGLVKLMGRHAGFVTAGAGHGTALNELHAHRRWYNPATTNCTTSIRTQRAATQRAPWDWRILLNGKGDELMFRAWCAGHRRPAVPRAENARAHQLRRESRRRHARFSPGSSAPDCRASEPRKPSAAPLQV